MRSLAFVLLLPWMVGLGACSTDSSGTGLGGTGGSPLNGGTGGMGGHVDGGSGGGMSGQAGSVDGGGGVAGQAGSVDGGPGGMAGQAGSPMDAGFDANPDVCVTDSDCGDVKRGCFAGLCRDRCTLFLNPCEWKPSGDVCNLNGFCVECQNDSDCPGSRYACNKSTFTCVDKPFDPTVTKIGIFYHTWHCPAASQVHDLTQILAGSAPYGSYNAFHWWGQPADGYYCLTNNTSLLTKHAELLRDMGVDFVFVDVTNHAWNSNALCDRPVEMIIEPFTTLVSVWSGIAGAPGIVPWVPVKPTDGSHPANKRMVDTLLSILGSHPGTQFEYEGKPLILVTENAWHPVDEAKLAALSADYTIRRMWAFESDGTARWSYLEKCDSSPLESSPCFQRGATLAGNLEQIPIASAYQADYMSHPSTATPKHHGKTFRKQFETLLNNPEVPIVTITGWNEWIAQRLKCDEHPACVCSNPQDVNGCFLDQYDLEYSRDIEPGTNAMGTYYYDLAKSCIALFRAGKRCTPDNAGDLCCKDWQPS